MVAPRALLRQHPETQDEPSWKPPPLGKGDVQGGPGCVRLPDGYEQPLSYFDPILWIGSVTVEGIFPVGRVLPGTGTSQPGENNEPGNAEGYHGG